MNRFIIDSYRGIFVKKPTWLSAHNNRPNFNDGLDETTNGSGMNGFNHPGDPPAGWPEGYGLPTTWSATYDGYQDEWQSRGGILDSGTSINGKIGWYVADLGEPLSLVEWYIWNMRENTGRAVQTFNVYHATSPAVTVPTAPTDDTTIDYDFSSAGWTKINSVLLVMGTFQGATAQAIIDLDGITARYLALEIITNGGDTGRTGLAEIGITYNKYV